MEAWFRLLPTYSRTWHGISFAFVVEFAFESRCIPGPCLRHVFNWGGPTVVLLTSSSASKPVGPTQHMGIARIATLLNPDPLRV